MDYYAIGQRIRKVRKARGISQEELAEKVGISTTHMSHIETGNTKLSLPVFVDLAEALEIRTDELLYDISVADRSISMDAIAEVLDQCTTPQLKLIADLVKTVKLSLDKNISSSSGSLS